MRSLDERRFGAEKKVISSFGGGFGLAEVGASVGCAAIAAGDFAGRSCGGGAFML